MSKKNHGLFLFLGLGAAFYFLTRPKTASASQQLPGPPSANNEPSPVTAAPVSLPDLINTSGGFGPPPSLPVNLPANPAMPVQVPLPVAMPATPPATPSLPTVMPPDERGESPVIPAPSATMPSIVDDLTAAMLKDLLTAEQQPGWKRKYQSVKDWQRARKLKVDGMFGKVSALTLAQEVGTIPLIRYWAKGDQPNTAVEAYRDALEAIAANAAEPRHAQLLQAAQREQGQGFAANPGPPASLITV